MASLEHPNPGSNSRRDRRGRGPRGPLAWPPVPAMRTRRERFDAMVVEAAERAHRYLGQRQVNVDFAVEDVPPEDPPVWEPQTPSLGRLVGLGRHGHRVVLYRRPIEARARDDQDLPLLVREVVTEQVALLLGVPPDEIDL